MLDILSGRWWAFVARGVAAVVFGLLTLFWPQITVLVLVMLAGVYVLVDGVLLLFHAFSPAADPRPRWVVVLQGVAGLLFGIAIVVWPGISAVVLVTLIALWALFSGVLQIAAAIRLRREMGREWLLAVAGVLSVVTGLLLLLWPGAGALALAWLIGLYALAFGVLLIVLGIRLREWRGLPPGL
ncbi:HdeD family acid-resistance protein [Marinactinospora thermotolerans]|uniref:Uncharacterized membrane protein HdeD, DUF308 family n=1 Tax=Marinactinospora thermotolerans DSM 45154 TaxID=1122192 RepID=A0A1T4TAT6_9ACTN|nr:HdeD family acid-resistance protein [Marinactinospora thermotolerans]SKA37680.1 Uncharacterized membrane protein HdeD, DUF308 family [Marinactinospora thermotolerans DSM 45154]